MDNDNSKLKTQNSKFREAAGSLLMVAVLAAAVLFAMGNPVTEYRYNVRKAGLLLEETRYSEAVALYERTLPFYDTPQVRLGLSYGYLSRRDPERAERQVRSALASAPPDLKPAAWAQLGRVLAFAGQNGEAVDAWAGAMESAAPYMGIAPIRAEAHSSLWHRAMALWSSGDYPAARHNLESLLDDTDIYATSARVKLAQLLAPTHNDISRGHIEALEGALGDADEKDASKDRPGAAIPDLRVPGVDEGLPWSVISDTVSGLRSAYLDAGKAKQEGTDEAGISALWGRVYLRLGEPHLARTYLERAVAARPDLSDAHSYLALALVDTGNPKEAVAHLETAERLDPKRPLPRYVLANLYAQSEHWDRAAAELRELKKLEPNSWQLRLQIAGYYAQRGLYDPAEDEYIEAMERQGDSEAPGGADAALALARFYTDVRGFGCEKGLPAARESLSRHPGDPASLDAVGWALVQCDMPVEALSSLESAVAASPDMPRFRYHLGKAYSLLGRADEARAQFSRSIDLDPGGPWEREALSAIAGLRTED